MSELHSISEPSPVSAVVPVVLAYTMDHPSHDSLSFKAGVKLDQYFRVQETGTPNLLTIGMGINKIPFNALLIFFRGDKVLLEQPFTGLVQTPSVWTTSFVLPLFDEFVKGEIIHFQLTVSKLVGIERVYELNTPVRQVIWLLKIPLPGANTSTFSQASS